MEIIKKRLLIKKNLRVGLIIFLVAVMAGAAYFMYFTKNNYKYVDKQYPVYSYTHKAKVNYSVFMIPNQIYTQKSLSEGNIYISKLINYIDTDLKYEFIGSKQGEIKGTYDVVAVLNGSVMSADGKKSILNKKYLLQPSTSFSGNDKGLTIQRKTPLKIRDIENYVNIIGNALGFNLDNKLTIMWNVSIQVKTDKGIVKEQLTPTMEIPLNEKYFDIKGNLTQEKKGTVERTKKELSPSYNNKIIASWIIEGLCVGVLLFIIFFTAPFIVTSAHQKKLQRIFKNHGIRMVAVNSEIAQMSNEFIEISSINDLVKIADDIGRPIFYKSSSNLEEITKFYVVDKGNVFVVDITEDLSNLFFSDKSNTQFVII